MKISQIVSVLFALVLALVHARNFGTIGGCVTECRKLKSANSKSLCYSCCSIVYGGGNLSKNDICKNGYTLA